MRTCLWNRAIAFVRAAAVIGCIVHSAPIVAITIRSPEPDPWFSVSFEIDTRSLPPGVELKRDYENAGGFAVSFLNSSSTPLYLVRTPSTPPSWVRDLPANIVPTRMAVSGAAFRMEEPGEWSREGEGIPVGAFLRLPPFQSAAVVFEMDAYLGNQKITIGGRYITEWTTHPSGSKTRAADRLELNSPLPAPLRLSRTGDPKIINDGPVPLYGPLRLSQTGDPKILPNPNYTGTVFSKPVGWATEVPFGFLALRKFVAGKSYYAELKNPSSRWGVVQSSADGWRESPGWDPGSTFTERNFGTYVPGFKFQQIYQDNRPSGVKVPDPQPFQITAFHGTRTIIIYGRILYALNEKYDPRAGVGPAMCTSCTGSMCDECAKINRDRTKAPKQ